MTNRLLLCAVAAAAATACVTPAIADPWIPPAGSGKSTLSIRTSSSDRRFQDTAYGTLTNPSSSTAGTTELRIVGDEGIGHNLAIQYDFRGASLTKASATSSTASTGIEDQRIGLVAGLYQSHAFAAALALNVTAPTGSTTSSPALGAGAFGIEPDIMLGTRFGGNRDAYATLTAGPRYYGGGAGRLDHVDLSFGSRLTPRFGIETTASMIHGFAPLGTTGPTSYDLTRLGLSLHFEMSKHMRLSLGYDDGVAGRNARAGGRMSLGVTIR